MQDTTNNNALQTLTTLMLDTMDVVKTFYDDRELTARGFTSKLEREGYELEVTYRKI